MILCGSQTWNTLQDWGTDGVVQPLDFDAFVNFLKAHGHNFTLLWRTELPKFGNLPVTAANPPDFTVSLMRQKVPRYNAKMAQYQVVTDLQRATGGMNS